MKKPFVILVSPKGTKLEVELTIDEFEGLTKEIAKFSLKEYTRRKEGNKK